MFGSGDIIYPARIDRLTSHLGSPGQTSIDYVTTSRPLRSAEYSSVTAAPALLALDHGERGRQVWLLHFEEELHSLIIYRRIACCVRWPPIKPETYEMSRECKTPTEPRRRSSVFARISSLCEISQDDAASSIKVYRGSNMKRRTGYLRCLRLHPYTYPRRSTDITSRMLFRDWPSPCATSLER